MSTRAPRTKARAEAAKTVTEVWHWDGPETTDPEFWAKFAAHDEALAAAYRALNRVTDDSALSMALQDAEEFRSEKAKDERRQAAAQAARAVSS